eukprot:gene31261-6403_t
MLENFLNGKKWPDVGDDKDTQAHCFVKVPALVARYAGSPLLPTAVDAAVRAQQNNQESVDAAMLFASILEKVVLGYSIKEAIEWATSPGALPAHMQDVVKDALLLR